MRVKRGYTSRKRHKKILKEASGFRGRRSTCFKIAKDAVEKSLVYAYRDRKARKREFRKLWIQRINAACRLNEITYSKFIFGLNKAGVNLNRKVLADIAYNNPLDFNKLSETAKNAIK